MATFRIHKTDGFMVLSLHHLKNRQLSLKAKGLLSLMLSLPDDWDYSVMGLASISKDGKDSIMSALSELSDAGYVNIENIRNASGQYESTYNVYETPNWENRCGKSESDNPTQYNNKIKNVNNPPLISKDISPKGGKKELDLSFIEDSFMPIMTDWLAYKREKKQTYKQIGLKGCYEKLYKMSNGNPLLARKIVEQSIANNYSGLFKLKDNEQSKITDNERWNAEIERLSRM